LRRFHEQPVADGDVSIDLSDRFLRANNGLDCPRLFPGPGWSPMNGMVELHAT
jgi:hypothetical protein